MWAIWSSRGAGCFRRKVCTEVLHPGGVLRILLSPLAARLQSDVGIKSRAFLYHTSAWNVFCWYYKYTCVEKLKIKKYQNIGTEAIVISLANIYMTAHFPGWAKALQHKSEGDKLQELLLSWNNAVMHTSFQRVSKLPKVTYSLVSITKSHI